MYKLSNSELISKCSKMGLNAIKGQKHELVSLIVNAEGGHKPTQYVVNYDGDLSTVAPALSNLKKLNIPKIKHILKTHAVSIHGKKDDLVLRLFLLRHQRRHLISYKEENALLDTITVAKNLIFEQVKKKLIDLMDVPQRRMYATSDIKTGKPVPLPEGVKSNENLDLLFEPLTEYLHNLRKARHGTETDLAGIPPSETDTVAGDDYVAFFEIGQRVKVKWTREELGDTGWRGGWYVAEVQAASLKDDEITIIYISEPDCTYSLGVTNMLAQGKLRFA